MGRSARGNGAVAGEPMMMVRAPIGWKSADSGKKRTFCHPDVSDYDRDQGLADRGKGAGRGVDGKFGTRRAHHGRKGGVRRARRLSYGGCLGHNPSSPPPPHSGEANAGRRTIRESR